VSLIKVGQINKDSIHILYKNTSLIVRYNTSQLPINYTNLDQRSINKYI